MDGANDAELWWWMLASKNSDFVFSHGGEP